MSIHVSPLRKDSLDDKWMPAKFLVQILVSGTQLVGRAFARAIREEMQASQAAAAARQGQGGQESRRKAAADAITGMSIQEAKQVLNISDIKDLEKFTKSYEHLFSVNDKSKGGSFYLQSKIVRAKERLDQEIMEEMQQNQNKQQKQEEGQKS